MLPFTHKYRPTCFKDIAGQDEAVALLRNISSATGTDRTVLLYGPPGTGKTSLAYAVAEESGLELLEVNASDFRNKDQIMERVGGAIQQQSLFFKGKLILIDEVDGLSGTKDRGGIQTIVKLLGRSQYAIILTAQNPWHHKFASLRRKCRLIAVPPLGYLKLTQVLVEVCKHENISFDLDALKTLARRAGGDCRAALHDLQSLIADGTSLKMADLEMLAERGHEESMPRALLKIFKTTDLEMALSAFEQVQEGVDDQFLWLDENLPLEYKVPVDLQRGYAALSKADIFRRRIRRWQHWRFLVYIGALLTGGVALAKDAKSSSFVQYTPTGRLLKIWWANQKNMKKKAIAGKIAEKTHSSTKEMVQYVDYYKHIFKKNKGMAKQLVHYLELSKEEVAWLKK